MAREIRYYYDEESCTFQPERTDLKKQITRKLSMLGGSMLLASVIVAVVFFLYDSPKEVLLKKQNTELLSQISQLEDQFASIEAKVEELHNTDNNFYRSLMSTDKTDDGEWNSGVGGAVEAADATVPQELEDAKTRIERLNYKIDIQNKSYDFLFKKLSEKEDELRHIPAIKPVPGSIISGFGMRMHPIQGFRKMHTGIDMEASTGTPVYAAGDGVVKMAGVTQGGYGLQIEVEHGSYGYVTKYAHLSGIKVKENQRVKRGDVIGYTGSSGLSKGPHLHYEIIKDGRKIDPIDYFYGDQKPQDYVKLREDAKVENESMD
ncbi:MAG: peptidoglycan DD-metalloendopeptidase family protein [Bacteroidia bacterium]|nr:peptidoglycan DD-metalloendopeptidase family protein [Bacteroidia bacterium]